MLPWEDTDSPFNVDTRALKMFIEQPVLGFNGKGPADRQFGHTDSNFDVYYVETRGSEMDVLQVSQGCTEKRRDRDRGREEREESRASIHEGNHLLLAPPPPLFFLLYLPFILIYARLLTDFIVVPIHFTRPLTSSTTATAFASTAAPSKQTTLRPSPSGSHTPSR